jgi:hypothetical protein
LRRIRVFVVSIVGGTLVPWSSKSISVELSKGYGIPGARDKLEI